MIRRMEQTDAIKVSREIISRTGYTLFIVSSETKTISAAIATSHPLAAAAGAGMIRTGGNAIDAAVAAICTLCVVTPMSVGFAGYGGTMVAYIAREKKVVAIDFDSRAPLKYSPELYTDPEDRRYSWRAISVPGVVAGLDLALRSFGTKTWKDVAAKALELAENGFVIEKKVRRQLEDWRERTDEHSIRAYFGSNNLPEVGDLWVQKDHARVIRALIEQGAAAMYRGDIPREICRQVQAHGGVLTEEDFVHYSPMLVDPVSISYRGHQVFTPPPPAGGISSAQAMKILEQFDVASMPRHGAGYVHTVAEALKRCWGDRNQYLGDPQFVSVPVDDLLSETRAARYADEIRDGGVSNITGKADSGAHTVNVVANDSAGNLVSMTATLGYLFGSGRVCAGYGIALGHGMSRFDYEEGHPNAPAPWKRMQHNMSPTLVMKDGRPRFAFGMPGGTKIVNVTAQLGVNLIEFGMPVDEAIRAPRVHTEGADPIFVTSSIEKRVVQELERMGHQVRREQTLGGPANAIQIDNGAISAASGNGEECIITI
jgi:gamma-glutamyltranspeptidase/glutathione hydrolase